MSDYFTAEHPFFPMPWKVRIWFILMMVPGAFFAMTTSVQRFEQEEYCQKLLTLERTFREASRSHFPRQCAMIDVTWGE